MILDFRVDIVRYSTSYHIYLLLFLLPAKAKERGELRKDLDLLYIFREALEGLQPSSLMERFE